MSEVRSQQQREARGGARLGTITTKIPARLDRLPWSGWHWMVVIGLIPSQHRGRIDIIINGTYWARRRAHHRAGGSGPAGRRRVADLLRPRRGIRARHPAGQAPRAGEPALDVHPPSHSLTVQQRKTISLLAIARTMFHEHPRRTTLGLSPFIGQAFLYNAITFGYVQILAAVPLTAQIGEYA